MLPVAGHDVDANVGFGFGNGRKKKKKMDGLLSERQKWRNRREKKRRFKKGWGGEITELPS